MWMILLHIKIQRKKKICLRSIQTVHGKMATSQLQLCHTIQENTA